MDKILKKLVAAYVAYRNGQDIMPDSEYDALEREYAKQINVPVGQVQHLVEAELTDEFRSKYKLPFAMEGIEQINDVSEDEETTQGVLDAYHAEHGSSGYLQSLKLDGVSILNEYLNGKFRRAFTKHDSTHGLDVTRHVLHIQGVPKTIPHTGLVYIRGEAIMSKADFNERWSAKNGGEYANPRNLVAGKINSKHPDEEALADIQFVAYELADGDDLAQIQQMKLLEKWGFETPHHIELGELHAPSMNEFVLNAKAAYMFEIDGVVLSSNSDGTLGKYKVIAETKQVKCIGVEWNLKKRGQFQPVALIEPTELGGVIVTRASAFHAYYIEHGRLPQEDWKPEGRIGPGAIIEIIRSGDVIPDIQQVITPAKKSALPDPEEVGAYEWGENGLHIYTCDENNPEVKFRKLEYFFDRLGIAGFRGGSSRKCFDAGYDSITAILKMSQSELQEVLGKASGTAVFESIRYELDGVWLPLLMGSWMGELCGVRKSEILYEAYEGNMLDWSGYTEQDIIDELKTVKGYGPESAAFFAARINDFNAFVKENAKVIKIAEYEKVELESSKLAGWKVVFTGFRDTDLEAQIVANGGELASWTKATMVVAKDKSVKRDKITAAVERGAKLMSRGEFTELLARSL